MITSLKEMAVFSVEDLFSKKSYYNIKKFNTKKIVVNNEKDYINIVWIMTKVTKNEQRRTDLKLHKHTFYELHFIYEGFASYTDENGKVFDVKAGEYLLIPPKNSHKILKESDEMKKFSVAFSLTDSQEGKYIFNQKITCARSQQWSKNIFDILAYAIGATNGAESIIVNNILESLILLVCDNVIYEYNDTLIQLDERINKAKRFIEDNSDRTICVREVAEHVHLSSKQLGRIFYEHEGMNVSEFIARAHCDKAKELLKNNDISIAGIAEQLCFSNEYNFSRFFKRMEGVTPRNYRSIKGIKK